VSDDVDITAMAPTETGADNTLRNGAMQDPSNMEDQAFHGNEVFAEDPTPKASILWYYNDEYLITPPVAVNPETLARPSVIIKSAASSDTTCNGVDRICIDYYETLTILEEPPGKVFRPPFFGTEKPLIPYTDFDSSILSSVAGINTMAWQDALDVVQSPNIGKMSAQRATAQGLHATINNQVSDGYDGYYTQKLNGALLKLAEDPGASSALKESLAINVAQMGIDLYYIHKNGANTLGTPYAGYGEFTGVPCGAWVAAGGFNQGQLTPILFAAALLDKSEWRTTINNNLSTLDGCQCFGETGFIQPNRDDRGKDLPTFGHLNTTLYYNIGDCDGSNRNCASVGGSSNAYYSNYDGNADGDPLSNTGSPTGYQPIVTGENLAAFTVTMLTPAVYDTYPANAVYWIEYMDRVKRQGDATGRTYFGTYDEVGDYTYDTYSASYVSTGGSYMWEEYEDCIDDQSCTGMNTDYSSITKSYSGGSGMGNIR